MLCYYVLSFVLWCPLLFPHKNDALFFFASSCLYEGSYLIYVVCICVRIVVLFFSTYYVPCVASFSGLSILHAHSWNLPPPHFKGLSPNCRSTLTPLRLVWLMVLNTTFNNIAVVSRRSALLMEETEVTRENHRPVASHGQALSHNVVSSRPCHERNSNFLL